MAAIHETIATLRAVRAIHKQTMRQCDNACLTAVRVLSAQQIKAIRKREHVTQSVFPNHLNVTPNLW